MSICHRTITPQEQKRLALNLLKFVDRICRENNIKYSLIGGSLIGAVRHQGYIPWDDDIDIILTRKNYTKLKAILDQEAGRYQTLKRGQGGEHYGFTKFIDTKTHLQENGQRFNKNYGVFLDIFCYYPAPNTEKMQIWHYKKLKLLYKLSSKSANTNKTISVTKKIAKNARNILSSIIGYKNINTIYLAIANKYTKKKTNYVINSWPVYSAKKEIQLAKNTEEYIDAKFENLTVMIFKNYDAILRTTFGDYMKLPPKSERIPKHNMQMWWREDNE